LSTQEDPPVFVATALDISERLEAERQMIHQANFDQLTKLPNRYYMMSHIDKAFTRSRRNNTKVSLLFMDLDNFKDINDSLGHSVGDELLKQVAFRLRSLVREADTPARFGGDEFLIMLEGLYQQGQAEVVAHKLTRCFKKPFFLGKHEIYTSASIGISTYPDDGNSADLLLQYADTAMYYAKQSGRNNYRFFSHELRANIDEQLAIESRLRHAIKNNELHLFFQPKINIIEEKIIGAEALLRWSNPDLGNVPPDVFIPIAEKYGLIEDIGSWVLEMACREASHWQTISSQDLHVAVNISPQQFRSKDLLKKVDNILQTSGLPAKLLEMEITETLLIQDTEEPLEILNALRERKITLSLDDFGTGYSSLSYLKRFPIQILKIDRSFIQNLADNQHDRSLVDAIIAMGHSLELRIVAEGVESQEQLEFLRKRNVKVVQGYLFSPPVSIKDFRALLTKFPSNS
jgi:diguanylate cyclase (GGDEF)-like protein